MKTYTHLTSEQRVQIRGLLNAKYTQAATAHELNVSPSTIGREMKRNLGQGHYVPLQANRIAS